MANDGEACHSRGHPCPCCSQLHFEIACSLSAGEDTVVPDIPIEGGRCGCPAG